ncbi:hypothetical protein EUGRSUZ_L00749 [Eucalyptus grandis]|uniref:Uncharacterized protein n=1 Tax=Eucalyptus grandis TaxID=71139 RepID=A0A058ZUS3_EUCGR|nr:hypothetical protein EUGRSUZ_L00748 [Eucalyptus grandis]KAK2633003.1 hypothetical protein EUGRSUZ_L00749 [Eucalyptus grandis]
MNAGSRFLYGVNSLSLSKNDIWRPFLRAIGDRTLPGRFPCAPVTTTVVSSLAKLASTIIASGSEADDASMRKI